MGYPITCASCSWGVVDGMTPGQFAELFTLTSETAEARLHNARSLMIEVLMRQFGAAFGGVYQLDDSRYGCSNGPAFHAPARQFTIDVSGDMALIKELHKPTSASCPLAIAIRSAAQWVHPTAAAGSSSARRGDYAPRALQRRSSIGRRSVGFDR
jgi:hypothetical protein